MPTQMLTFNGEVAVEPPSGNNSGQPTVLVSYSQRVAQERQLVTTYTLDADPVVSVDFGPLTEVNFLSITAVGNKIRVRITSADGTTQAIPVDPSLILRCDSVGITAIDLMRTATYDTDVYLVMTQIPD